MKCEFSIEDNFYGTATVGERGQIVIPSEARKQMGINSGDKMLVVKHPTGEGIVLFKIGAMSAMFSALLEEIQRLESTAVASGDEPNGD
ncbi:MAG: AbrB/MazE/SpoVT family DNA-binding domain-containing protein [Armatimonadota bacterium]